MLNNIIATIILSANGLSTPPASPPEPQGMPFSSFMLVQEKPEIVLYYKPACPYSQRVLKYLKLINKTVTLKDLESNPEAKSELIHIGGKPQVPCLVVDGKALYESEDIVTWLSQHQHLLKDT